MNISGKSAALAMRAYLQPARLQSVIIMHDSLSHKPLAISHKFGGSANGHNGVTSAISSLGGPGFHRLRLGIGRPAGEYHDYVLEGLSLEERKWWGQYGDGVDNLWKKVEEIVIANTAGT